MAVARHYVMIAREGQEAALRDALIGLAASVRPLAGCEGVAIFNDPDDPSHFQFVEHWASKEDHKAAGQALGKEAFSAVMAALAGRPEGRYLTSVGA